MYTSIASAITTLAVLSSPLPVITESPSSSSAAGTSDFQILERHSFIDDSGFDVEYAIWRESDDIAGDASVHDPATGDHVEMWIRGDSMVFEGMINGEPINGAERASVLYADPSEPRCLGWVVLICAGAAALAAGCAFGWTSCGDSETTVPGGQGGDPGGGGGGGGDGGGDSDGDGGGGDAED